MSTEISPLRLAIWCVIQFGISAALLFGGAGTVAWPEAWIYLLVQTSFSLILTVWLKRHDPELLKARLSFWKREMKGWDKALLTLWFAGSVPLFVIPGLDAVRYRWSHVPILLQACGFVGIVVASGLVFWVFKSNPYASASVEIQEDRGQTVVTTGPYHYVRHPMYSGVFVWYLCLPLALGSFITFVPAIVLLGLLAVRTHLEDKTLHQELPGYAAYAETVKFRLIPGIW